MRLKRASRAFRASAIAPLTALALFGLTVACGDDTAAPVPTSDAGPDGTVGNGDRHVVVLFTSDEHSHLFAFSPELDDFPMATAAGSGPLVGGVARRAAVIASLRKEAADAGKDSILVSAGDNQMGCLTHLAFESGSIDYRTMKALGYDATTFGNHEFDFGPAALASSIQAAASQGGLPPIVASNIHFSQDPADDSLAALYSDTVTDTKPVHPYQVLTTKGGVKVGILGFVGINAAHVAPNKTPVAFSAPVDPKNDGNVPNNIGALYNDLQPVVDKLRNDEKVDLVVALSHAGVNDTSTDAGIAAGEDPQICQNVNGIDLIVSGHAHNHDPKPMKMTNKANKPCLVLNAGSFGEEIGRVDFTIPKDATQGVSWDATSQKLVPVNESTAPDATLAGQVSGYVSTIEAAGKSGSTLATFLTHAEGATVSDDTGKAGDLYFHPLASTDFDVTDRHALVWLSADAMLAQADALVPGGLPATDASIESAGVIRAVLAKGKTGVISAADAFNVVPLGASPADGSVGYPLVRGNVTRLELRAVFELALAAGDKSTDYELGAAGLKVEFDMTRPAIASSSDLIDPTKGRVMKISLDTDHSDGFEQFDTVIYDRNNPVGGDGKLVSVVTSSYIAQFAADAGVAIKDGSFQPLALKDAIVKRPDASEVKQVESFMRFLKVAPSGKLPSLYDAKSASYTKRWVCLGGC